MLISYQTSEQYTNREQCLRRHATFVQDTVPLVWQCDKWSASGSQKTNRHCASIQCGSYPTEVAHRRCGISSPRDHYHNHTSLMACGKCMSDKTVAPCWTLIIGRLERLTCIEIMHALCLTPNSRHSLGGILILGCSIIPSHDSCWQKWVGEMNLPGGYFACTCLPISLMDFSI